MGHFHRVIYARKWVFSDCIFPCKDRTVDSVFIRENKGHRKPVLFHRFQESKFWHQKNGGTLGLIIIHFPIKSKT